MTEISQTVIELLTPAEMAQADRLAIAAGEPGLTLMERAGLAIADVAAAMAPAGGRIVVLAGPGNNGGDGFVAARLLAERGFAVVVALLGNRAGLAGDAAQAAARWTGRLEPFAPSVLAGAQLIVDAIFGAGLSREVTGEAARMIDVVNAGGVPVLAVDVPSGIDGETGRVRGTAIKASRCVTFFRLKPGHLLLPGRIHCGPTSLFDIGIPAGVLRQVAPRTWQNRPALWRHVFPQPAIDGHKYTRGHAVVVSGPAHATGAARLGARGALRAGAGLVTLACPAGLGGNASEALLVNAAHVTAIMLRAFSGSRGFATMLAEDARINTVLVGPGAGLGRDTAELVLAALGSRAAVVLDADALTVFSGRLYSADASIGFLSARPDYAGPERQALFAAIGRAPERAVVMTPHEGEFARLFPESAGSKLQRARAAAAQSGAVVVLKGPDTVVAAPDGRAAIADNAPPFLATAGSGDVLAGFVTGLLAQHMPAFEAAAAAVWLHGACAARFGPGLIAEDLPETLPAVLTELFAAVSAPMTERFAAHRHP